MASQQMQWRRLARRRQRSAPAQGAQALDRRLKLGLLLLAGGILTTVAASRASTLAWRRAQDTEAAERRAGRLASILAAQLGEAVQAADDSLRQLALQRHIQGPVDEAEAWASLLAAAHAGLSGVRALSVTDAAGTVRHSTREYDVGKSQPAGLLRRLSSEGGGALVVGEPTDGVPAIPLARRIATRDGRFGGMAVATFMPAELRSVFEAVDVGRGGAVCMFTTDGSQLYPEPAHSDADAPNPIVSASIGRNSGRLRGTLEPGGPVLLSAFRRVDHFPLVVAVSLSEREALAGWRRELYASTAIVTLLAGLMAGGLILLFRQVDARAAAERALERAQRLESIGQLTGGLAHDFNNLLTIILGNVQRLKESHVGERTQHGLEQVELAARRAADLIRRLLAFARRQPLQPQLVDLNRLVLDLQPMLTRLLGEDVTLGTRLSREACLARVDPVQTETALMNLCVNARDAMPAGGRLDIATGPAVLDEAYARLNAEVFPGRYSSITVSDTGVGIPPEHLSRLFEPFFSTKDAAHGTGLGLSMVYGFVKQSKGHVKVYSELGRGTTVKVYFPEVTGEIEVTPPPEPVFSSHGTGQTVLVVEDEPALRELAVELLRDLGYVVIAAPDGPSALAMARRGGPLDLLLTDLVLPGGLDGPELARQMVGERPDLRVVYTSGYSADALERRGPLEHGGRFLAKPYTLTQLATEVATALREEPSRTAGA